MARVLDIIDLFAGCGGLTSGFLSTGRYRSVAAVELDTHAAASFAQNFGDHVHVGDIADWAEGSLPRADVVLGGPPCQGFSALGKQDPNDPRNGLWRHYLSVLTRVRPAFFVLENVPQFLTSREFDLLRRETTPSGLLSDYALEAHLLWASDYGVPQARRRAVVVGRRRALCEIGAPRPAEKRVLAEAFPTWLAPEAAVAGLPDSWIPFRGKTLPGAFTIRDLHVMAAPSPLALARYRAIPEGGSRRDLPEELKMPCWRTDARGAGDVMGRLRWDKPAVTIRTEFFKPEKGRFLHPDQHRPVTHAEAAFIQGFPEAFLWCGTKSSIARQIGNAVPPPMAAAIGHHLASRIG